MQQKKRKLHWYQTRRVRRATKRTLKWSGYTLTILGSALLLYLLCTFILSRIPVKGQLQKNASVHIYLMKSGVHTDFVLPVSNEIHDWTNEFPIANTDFKDSSSQLISIGWGDKTFYMNTPTWADLTLKTALTTPFGLGPSAIHATYYRQLLDDRPTISLKITKKQYKKLVRYIQKTLVYNNYKQTKLIKPTLKGVVTGNDAYYAAKGRYSIFFTCNSWINSGLKVADQKASLWTAFASGIFYQYGK
ncbi:MAG: hypothetical protein RLZZ38_972 [Bacteroidota bacterium]|jgi:uncharacterized protein (TIGR02117 family)